MCGIAGYSLKPDARIDRTLAAQALLAGIAERGADAVGYAHRSHGDVVSVHKQRSGASAFLPELTVPASSVEVLLHVRDYTKGHPTIEANNHPVRHGQVVGVHNGIILNDEEIFERHAFQRHEPSMTVDTEAIFALVKSFGPWGRDARAAPRLHGDGVGRRARARRGLSRPRRRSSALDGRVPRRHLLRLHGARSGGLRAIPRAPAQEARAARRARSSRSRAGVSPARSASAPTAALPSEPLPAVRAPGERESCLRLLTALASL